MTVAYNIFYTQVPIMASFHLITRYNELMQNELVSSSQLQSYQHARQSRDARFDGLFFVAVKTTGIYCRPICPATTPKEKNIEYFTHAHQAVKAGYRPCLRCHPDSAPGSPLWKGVSSSLERAKKLIDEGALDTGSMSDLSDRLGITERYLRKLFDKHLGISPKAYALFRQCEFAKNLLHQTTLPITEIALASGFNSVRRFNDCFKKQLSLTPSQIRKSNKVPSNTIQLKLYYRPPYDWQHLQQFFATRMIDGLEWTDKNSYGRTFLFEGISSENDSPMQCKGHFTAQHNPNKHRFDVTIEIDNIAHLKMVVNTIRRILDLDTDSKTVEQCLRHSGFINYKKGLRLPGTWSLLEAGIRAILGQQISVVAALNLVKSVIDELGEKTSNGKVYFPTAKALADADFEFIKMPGKRKETLTNLAKHFLHSSSAKNPESWLTLKGIGPWTIDYAKMRGLSDPDIYLGGDLGVKKVMDKPNLSIDPTKATPFRSYLTFQLWHKL